MHESPNFFPILQPRNWRGATECWIDPLNLNAEGDAKHYPLVVSYGQVNDRANSYIMKDDNTVDRAAARTSAMDHLRAKLQNTKWTKIEGGEYLCAIGDEVMSSGILLPSIRKGLFKHFSSRLSGNEKLELIGIAVPHRMCIVAGSNLMGLGQAAKSMYEEVLEEGGPALSPLVMLFDANGLVGVQRSAKESEQPESNDEPAEDDDDETPEDDPSLAIMVAAMLVMQASGRTDGKAIDQLVSFLKARVDDRHVGAYAEDLLDRFTELANHCQEVFADEEEDAPGIGVLMGASTRVMAEDGKAAQQAWQKLINDLCVAIAKGSGGGLFGKFKAPNAEVQGIIDGIDSALTIGAAMGATQSEE